MGVVDDVRNMGFFNEQTCTAFIMNDRDRTFNVRLKEPEEENFKKAERLCEGSLSEQNVGILHLSRDT